MAYWQDKSFKHSHHSNLWRRNTRKRNRLKFALGLGPISLLNGPQICLVMEQSYNEQEVCEQDRDFIYWVSPADTSLKFSQFKSKFWVLTDLNWSSNIYQLKSCSLYKPYFTKPAWLMAHT